MKWLAHDCYIGILAPNELAALSSLKMATALGQVVLASRITRELRIPSRVYNLEVTSEECAFDDMKRFTAGSRRPLCGMTLVAEMSGLPCG